MPEVEPTTSAEVAPLNQLAEDLRPERDAAVAAKALAEGGLAEGVDTTPVPAPAVTACEGYGVRGLR